VLKVNINKKLNNLKIVIYKNKLKFSKFIILKFLLENNKIYNADILNFGKLRYNLEIFTNLLL